MSTFRRRKRSVFLLITNIEGGENMPTMREREKKKKNNRGGFTRRNERERIAWLEIGRCCFDMKGRMNIFAKTPTFSTATIVCTHAIF